ncbi:hypothetical protein [Nibricoccus aquaticus]|uniref:hypothetical protein n=1 Tax=Nibricoccus aquaticus TaxID=2576891 RepID=UPI001586E359|nr:hypothetical protein [Nibricoccus aquaticus]
MKKTGFSGARAFALLELSEKPAGPIDGKWRTFPGPASSNPLNPDEVHASYSHGPGSLLCDCFQLSAVRAGIPANAIRISV